MTTTYSDWNYHVEALAMFGCPECGSEDLDFYGDTGDRTDGDYTDHVSCEKCGAEWTAPIVDALTHAAEQFGVTMDQGPWEDALVRAEAAGINNGMAYEDARLVARGIVATVMGMGA